MSCRTSRVGVLDLACSTSGSPAGRRAREVQRREAAAVPVLTAALDSKDDGVVGLRWPADTARRDRFKDTAKDPADDDRLDGFRSCGRGGADRGAMTPSEAGAAPARLVGPGPDCGHAGVRRDPGVVPKQDQAINLVQDAGQRRRSGSALEGSGSCRGWSSRRPPRSPRPEAETLSKRRPFPTLRGTVKTAPIR